MGIKTAFRRTMVDFIRWITRNEEDEKMEVAMSSNAVSKRKSAMIQTTSNNNIEDGNQGMNFTVYHATGGKIIQIRTYDSRTDRTSSELYIVTDKEDLGEELAQIITRESLTR